MTRRRVFAFKRLEKKVCGDNGTSSNGTLCCNDVVLRGFSGGGANMANFNNRCKHLTGVGLFVSHIAGTSCMSSTGGGFCLKRTCNLHTFVCFRLCHVCNNMPLELSMRMVSKMLSPGGLCVTHTAPGRMVARVGGSLSLSVRCFNGIATFSPCGHNGGMC